MLRCTLWVGLLAVLAVCPFRALRADDKKADGKKAWQEAELKKLAGRWTTVREEKTDPDKTRRRRVDLEFADGELSVSLFDEKGAQEWNGSLKVIGVEGDGERRGLPFLLKLDKGGAYYDLVEEKLVVVGRIWPRPWEGFPLSGEYKRGAKPK